MGSKKKNMQSVLEAKNKKVTKKDESCCDDHKAKTGFEEVDMNPPTKKQPCKPVPSEGDAKWCKECNANTFYGTHCLVCSPFTEEQMLKYAGNLQYLKKRYSKHVTFK